MLKNLEIALNKAIQDEYKACETCRLVIQKFGAIWGLWRTNFSRDRLWIFS